MKVHKTVYHYCTILLRHPEFLRQYCEECGRLASLETSEQILNDTRKMDSYVHAAGKTRVNIKRDGHCLPRAVFRGAKEQDLIAEHITYLSLFKASVKYIKDNISNYKDFLTESKENAFAQIDRYVNERSYALPSNIIDILLIALAQQSSSQLKIHYIGTSGFIDTHIISSGRANLPTVELCFMHGHYDLISRKTVTTYNIKTEISNSTNLGNDDNLDFNISNVESASDGMMDCFSTTDSGAESEVSDTCSSDSNNETIEDVSSIVLTERAWRNVVREKVHSVPHDIDGLVAFEMCRMDKNSLTKACRDGRFWKNDSSTKWANYDSVRYKNCGGNLQCPNDDCEMKQKNGKSNKLRFGVDKSCMVCGAYGVPFKCNARKYTAKKGDSVYIFHFGRHSCEPKLKFESSSLVNEALMSTPNPTPSSIQSNVVLSSMRKRKAWEEVEKVALRAANRKSLENELSKQKKQKGSAFTAIKEYKTYTDDKDKFLINDVNENKATVFKTSVLKLDAAKDMCTEGLLLSGEVCCFDGNEKRTKLYTTLAASAYHPLLRKQVSLATMECPAEDSVNVEAFWRKFNKAYSERHNISDKFHPKAGWVTDMAESNFIGLKMMYGEDVMDDVKACEFHYLQSVDKVSKSWSDDDIEVFKGICNNVLKASNKTAYKHEHGRLRDYLKDRGELQDWVDWWHNRRFVVFRAFTGYDRPRANQAEVGFSLNINLE